MAKKANHGGMACWAVETGVVLVCTVFAGLGIMKLRRQRGQRRRTGHWDAQAAEQFMQQVRVAGESSEK